MFIHQHPPPPNPKAEGGRMGARSTRLARTRLHPRMVVGVCPEIRCLHSPPRPLHPPVNDSISLARQPIAKGTESYSFLLFPGQSLPAIQRGFPDKR